MEVVARLRPLVHDRMRVVLVAGLGVEAVTVPELDEAVAAWRATPE